MEINVTVPEIPATEIVYFPAFPYPEDDTCKPLDKDLQLVTSNDVEVSYVLVPFWYWKQILNFAIKTDEAVNALNAARKPP